MRSARAKQSVGTRSRTRTLRQAASRAIEPLETRRLLASIVVNSTADNAVAGDGLTTLREAISAANSTPSVADTITFNLGAGAQTINLGSELPNLSTNMTIQGPGADLLTVRRNTLGNYGIFAVPGGTVTLAGLTISNGRSTSSTTVGGDVSNLGTLTINECVISEGFASYYGGGINNFGVLTVNNTVIRGNIANGAGGFADYGGAGIYNHGTATLNNCTVSDNSTNAMFLGGGGGIYNQGSLTVSHCTISGNASTWTGGGIANDGALVVTATLLSSNTAGYLGGGINNYGTAEVSDSTLIGNSGVGGGTQTEWYATLSINRCTISGNVAPYYGVGGVGGNGTQTMRGSIVAGNTGANGDPDNVNSWVYNVGYNFIGGDPKLAPLADNGGATKTMALLPDSPCINRGDPNFTGPPDFDQRGASYARKVGARVDIGAFESDVLNTVPTTIGSMASLTVLDDSSNSAISLRDSFDDAEDGAAGLVYTIVGNTNPALFAFASVDDRADVLTLDFADGSEGVATITVRATDPAGLFVEDTLDVTVLLSSFVVNSAADDLTFFDGSTTLREAITLANLNSDANTITFDLGPGAHTINLTGWLPDLSTDMNVEGPGSDLLTVRRDTGDIFRIFTIGSDAVVNLSDITITNGSWIDGAGGVSNHGSAAISRCVITDNYAFEAGGVYNRGMLLINDSTIGNNTAEGIGGIFNDYDGQLTVNGSTVSGNTAGERGGIFSFGGPVTISNSTISGNTCIYVGGGGIGGYFNSLVIRNSSVVGNSSAVAGGGGVFVEASASLDISNSIIAQNGNGDLFIAEIEGSVGTLNHNFIGDDHPGVDPLLGPLADNGGPTKTMALLPGSPLINAGDPNFASPPDHDQRGAGFDRVLGGRIDIGAFEYNASPTTTGVPDLTVPEDAADSSVNLRDSFDDAEDGPASLVYTIIGNTNPSLFAAASIDAATDLLALDYADDANGVATIAIRATDRQGQFVDDTFTVNVLSVQQQVQRLQQQVQALPGLKAGNRNALLGKLALKGNDGDLDKVSSFINGVQDLFEAGKISADNAGALVAAANGLLVSLN